MASLAEIEAEIADAHRKIKQVESIKRTQVEESARIIASQRSTIDKLKQENRQLQEELSIDSKVG